MVGRTLTEIRDRLRELASPEGGYLVRCGRTGERPVPVDDVRFPDRDSGVEAVRAAHAYRATLRRYDPRAPWYDLVVCEEPVDERAGAAGRDWTFPPAPDRSDRARVAYCHDVAGAVFEALSASAHDDLERSVMDAYLAAAEETTDRDRLCLALLSTIAVELDALSPAATDDVLERATTHLPTVGSSDCPVRAALDYLRTRGVLEDYRVVEGDAGPQRIVVRGYELPPTGDRLPTLPVTVEACRRAVGPAPVVERARRHDPGVWALSVTTADATPGSATVPVAGES